MTDTLLQRIVLPVASIEDAKATTERVLPRLRDNGSDVLAVHVIEKAGGAPDKASVEQRENRARDIFSVVEETLSGVEIDVETRIPYGTDIAQTVLDTASEFDASSIVFTPRSGSRWVKLLTGDTALGLLNQSDRPVIVLPDDDKGGSG
ncbi:universal stress protein [Halorussus ruber]|uniref:universal stress protein n=1 Tax=Halorussus ruber TaxID=1126238 RepID=UPI00109214C7|nr:universal stress protein [Halorussus ruber]